MNAENIADRTPGPDEVVSRVGAVDMGSKNFKYVLGQKTNGVITTELIRKERFELGKEVTENNGLIGEEKIAQVKESLSRFVRYCSDRGAPRVLAIATSAIRNARNHQRILDVAREAGLSMEIAEGVREGVVDYYAATGGAPLKLVSDVGSKSMQIAWEEGGAIRSRSVQVGYEMAYETFVEHELMFHDSERKFRRFLDGNFKEFPGSTDRYIALAANTVASFVNAESHSGSEKVFDREALAGTLIRLRALPASGYRELKASLPKAVKILPGLIFIDWLMERTGHRQVLVSQNELPVGLIVEYFLDRT